MKTLADLINAMDFSESLELAKEICDSRLAGILSDGLENVKQIAKTDATAESSAQNIEMITFYDSTKARDTLINMGIKPSNKGFKYLMDSVRVLESDPTYLNKITVLYYKVARLNNSTSGGVERAIRHSVSRAKGAKGAMFYEVIPSHVIKCTNKEFITYLVMYLSKCQ